MWHKLTKGNLRIPEYVFCLVVGGIYIYALTSTIFSATIIDVGGMGLFAMGLLSMVVFLVAFHNRATCITALGLLVLAGAYLGFVFWQNPYYNDLHPRIDHLNQVIRMVTGHTPYLPELGRTLAWAVCLLFGALVAIFMFFKFNFILLAGVGVSVFLFTWGPGFSRNQWAFLLFLFVFLALLIRRMNDSATATLIVVPLCAIAIGVVQMNVPTESNFFVRRSLNQSMTTALEVVSDFVFEIFNPTYFSFQSTGFAGAGGRLGGAVTLNNRHVMDVTAPGGIYLAGAVSNTFTGYSWIQTLEPGAVYTHGLPPAHFEMLETAAALLRGATLAHYQPSFTSAALLNFNESDLLATGDMRSLNTQDFNTLGVIGGSFFLHSYMPVNHVEISMRRQRTGTIFRPLHSWQLAFGEASNDYLPLLNILPTGDMQAPGMMSRGTQYSFHFANPNTQLEFVENLLRESSPGVYSRMNGTNDWWQQHTTFGGEIVGFESPEHFWFDHRNVFLSENLENWFEDPQGLTSQDVWELWFGGFNPWIDHRIPQEIRHFQHLDTLTVEDMGRLLQLWMAGPENPDHEWVTLHNYGFVPHESYILNWLDMFATDVLAPYAQQIRENFMEVPDIVPQRVHDLTLDIIHGLDNDFARVMAIRDYLMQFPYTLDTIPVPRGVCFVDHFLFYGREGYCTYFASAMAIMARIAGVPSRYVEGFVLPPSRYPVAAVAVTNRMAHAWVEVYLEGFGWMIVEATPPYAFLTDPGLFVAGGSAAAVNFDPDWVRNMGNVMFDWEYYWYLEYWMEDTWLGGSGFDGMGVGAVQPQPQEPVITPQNVRNMALILPLVLLLGVGLYAALCFGRVELALKKIKRQDPNTQALQYFKGLLAIVQLCSVPLAQGETPYAYGQHNGKRFAFKSGSVMFKEIIGLYYKAKYSPHQLTDGERALIEEAYFDMVNYLRNVNAKYMYLYLRYVRRVGAI